MARKRKADSPWDDDSVDALVDGMIDVARKHYGSDKVFTGTEAEQRLVGLKLPALSACQLFQSTVFPLSRMTQLVGLRASGKSTFLFEIFRWFRSHRGSSLYLEAETKDSPDMRNAILNYDPKAVFTMECDFVEDWQDRLQSYIKWVDDISVGTSSHPGPGYIRPFCCGIDSLMGKSCRESVEKIDKAGHADRSFPKEALVIAQFMRAYPHKIRHMPVCVIGTNHLKPSTDNRGRPIDTIPGGKSIGFQETFEIKLTRTADIHRATYEGYTVKMSTTKNSLGPDHKSVSVDLIRWREFDESTGEPRLRALWNWEGASIGMLLEMQKDPSLWERINEACDLHPVRTKGNRVWSKALGIPSSSPATYREAGMALEKDTKVLIELYKILGIRRRMVFTPGEEYESQRQKAREVALLSESEASVTYKPPEETEQSAAPDAVEDGSYDD